MSNPAFIFLDFDGVLNSTDWQARRPPAHPVLRSQPFRWFDPECVERLNVIVGKTGAKVVVTSSWRGGRGLTSAAHLDGFLHCVGFTGEVIASTPDLTVSQNGIFVSAGREQEIRETLKWLNAIHSDPDSALSCPWVVLDDDPLDFAPEHFVRTDFQRGLTESDAGRAIVALMKQGASSLSERIR